VDIVDRLKNAISNEDNDGQLLDDAADEILMLRRQLDEAIQNAVPEYDSLIGSMGA